MIANTEAQRSLHPELVGVDASRVIDVAAAHGAIGWKVNGAGGEGGSLTILSATPGQKQALDEAVAAADRAGGCSLSASARWGSRSGAPSGPRETVGPVRDDEPRTGLSLRLSVRGRRPAESRCACSSRAR